MNSDFFIQNRARLRGALGGDLVVLTAYTQMQRSNDAAFRFEQEANFWWATGIGAPDWQVIIDTAAEKSWLVAPDIDDAHQIFDGSLSWDDAKKISGIENVIPHKDSAALLAALAANHKGVLALGDDPHAQHYDFAMNPSVGKLFAQLGQAFAEVSDCRLAFAKLRAIKQPAEQHIMQHAIDMTAAAFSDIHDRLGAMTYEYEVEAAFTHAFRSNGAAGHAYDPIVAGGKNACTLHYNDNNMVLPKNGLVLIDIGARVGGYAADITRTYAVGTPTQRQKDVHVAVETAHHAIINLLRPSLSVVEYHDAVDGIMKQALIGLGLMKSTGDAEAYRRYFPHAVSHGLGIDVHDSLGRPETLQPGMVLTVEPGIYIPEEGIGVRIEDDILITDTGYRNLSAALPTSL